MYMVLAPCSNILTILYFFHAIKSIDALLYNSSRSCDGAVLWYAYRFIKRKYFAEVENGMIKDSTREKIIIITTPVEIALLLIVFLDGLQ